MTPKILKRRMALLWYIWPEDDDPTVEMSVMQKMIVEYFTAVVRKNAIRMLPNFFR